MRDLSSPLTAGNTPPVSALAFDEDGRLYVANPGMCDAPGEVHRLGATFQVEASVAVGVCPFGIGFATLPGE